MLTKYMTPRSRRTETRTKAGRFRGGKLAPVMAMAFEQSESGTVEQTFSFELDPVAGRMISEVSLHLVTVMVPALAIDEIKDPEATYPGNAEIFREKLLSGVPVFDLENENEITQRCGIEPMSINGVKKVCEITRLGSIAAVNYLRRRKYVKAAQLDNTFQGVSPALIGSTVLDRFNAVLDPEDRINGAVSLEGKIPVRGIGKANDIFVSGSYGTKEAGGTDTTYTRTHTVSGAGSPLAQTFYVEEDPDNPGYPNIYAHFGDGGSELSLQQFYNAEKMDERTRELREIVDKYPEYGEEIVARIVHGLHVDTGKQPFVVYEREMPLRNAMQRAMDGPSLDVEQSNIGGAVNFMVPIPQTEFGGLLITFAAVKPDEVVASQPHPILSKPWGAHNYLVDEFAIDPDPVIAREVNADIAQADENTIVFYAGRNHMYRNYVNYGFTRNLDLTTVEAKTAIWQLQVPLSVTPQSVIYPSDIDHYPFADQTAEIVQYTASLNAVVNTPRMYGPTPVEELASLDTENVFEDQPEE